MFLVEMGKSWEQKEVSWIFHDTSEGSWSLRSLFVCKVQQKGTCVFWSSGAAWSCHSHSSRAAVRVGVFVCDGIGTGRCDRCSEACWLLPLSLSVCASVGLHTFCVLFLFTLVSTDLTSSITLEPLHVFIPRHNAATFAQWPHSRTNKEGPLMWKRDTHAIIIHICWWGKPESPGERSRPTR